jgi:hypothetical protein
MSVSIEGVAKLTARLNQMKRSIKDGVDVEVGFAAPYALFVHENLEMKLKGQPRPSGKGVYWGPSGQAKYLEQPAREMRGELGKLVGKLVKAGTSFEDALMIAGLKLQRAAQKLVPVEYGELRQSAFTKLTKGGK